jgi:hypothetical protein
MKCTFLAVGVLGLSTLALAVDIKSQNGGFSIQTPVYSAVVSQNGSVSSIKSNNVNFINANVSISRGTYFYQDGVLDLNAPTKASDDTVAVEGARSKATYQFTDKAILCHIENTTDKAMSFFFILQAKANAATGADNKWVKAPLVADWKTGTWFASHEKINFKGITRIWGPWEGGTQVVECILNGKQSADITVNPGKASIEETREAAKLNPESDYSVKDLEIDSPRNLQVFQRQTLSRGYVLVSGRAKAPHEKLEYAINGKPLSGKLPKGWQPLANDPVTGAFNQKITVPSGGWYKLEIRSTKAGKVVTAQTIEKFGVGEVFVTAGQSNSTNYGQFKTKQTSGMVSSFSGSDWRIADDPQPGPHDKSQGGSCWPAFGDAMYARYHVPIGIAVTGHGGTSVNQWQPGDELHNWMMTRINQLGVGGFRAVLWHQGEGDVQMDPEEYVEKMTNVINGSTRLAGWQFPWMLAQVSYHNVDHPSWPNTRAAFKLLWDRGIALEGPDTDTLTGDNRDYDGKGIHFSPKGLQAHGKMWAACVGAYLDKILKK